MKRFVLFLSLMVMMLSLSVAGSNTSPPVLQPVQQLDEAPNVMIFAPVAIDLKFQAPMLELLYVDLSPVLVVDYAVSIPEIIPTYCEAPVTVAFHPPDILMAAVGSTNNNMRATRFDYLNVDTFAHTQFY